MKFAKAKKLQNGDEVEIKLANRQVQPATVVEIQIDERNVFVRCDDGSLYHHTALK